MMGPDRLLSMIQRALSFSAADQTEVTIERGDTELTRVANNVIHQHVAEASVRVAVRVAHQGRVGLASTSRLDDAALQETVETAAAVAANSRPDPEFPGFPGPQSYAPAMAFDEETAGQDPRERALAIARVTGRARQASLSVAGYLAATASELAMGNSLGLTAYHRYTRAGLTFVFSSPHGSGYASDETVAMRQLGVDAAATRAQEKCLLNRNQVDIEPGPYTVILEPEAVATFLSGLTVGFSGEAVKDGRSPLGRLIGEKLVGENISLWDDGLDPRGEPSPFDAEGTPKRRVELIQDGVVKNVVHSRSSAAGLPGAVSTGHAISARGPGVAVFPAHVFMATGEASLEEMIASTSRGLLVTRFWYHRMVHPMRTLVTGLTRDGTFLVEDGRVVAATKNLRYTHPVVEALNHVEAIGREARWCGMHVPAIKVGGFRFTGVTTH
jgi:predicted Zn-dependent protease